MRGDKPLADRVIRSDPSVNLTLGLVQMTVKEGATKDEIISSLELPIANKKNKIFSWKLSKRYDQDISTISLAINIRIQNNIIKELYMAAGGVAATPKLLDKLCKQMVEKNLDDSIEFAIYNLDKFIQPISDLRGSSFYRLEAMKGLFKRLQICLKQDKESLSIMEVWEWII